MIWDRKGIQKADCHSHTHFSDGSLSPQALLECAKAKALHGLSITDHDTIAAYETAIPLAATLGIALLSGIEISTEHQKTSIHVLGYAFDLHHPTLKLFCTELQEARHQRNQQILERLAHFKVPVTLAELQAAFPQGILGRPHIAYLMFKKGYVKSPQQAFKRYLGENAPCYVSGFNVNVEKAIELIQAAGGYAVLAHPHYIDSKRIVAELIEMPFDGLEGFYGRLSPKQEQPWLEIAEQKGWMITGGSDFHGEKKSTQSLGCAWTPIETFNHLMARFKQHTSSALNN